MAGERVKLVASERTQLGSRESRRLRRQGFIPGVLYGREQPVAISVGERDLRAALTTRAGSHAVLDVEIDGGKQHSAILKDYQRDAVRGQIVHIDLQEVRLDQPIQTAVQVTLIGEPVGVKEGGVLSQVSNEVMVEALPLEVPQHLDVDVSGMHIGDTLRLSELEIPAGVTLLDDPDEVVLATVTLPTRIEEPEEVLEEGEEPAEGVAEGEQPESAGESPAEPDAAGAGGESTPES
jgi:large subunit ribosomal protein L25